MRHEALFYQVEDDNKVSCHLCPHRCVIADGKLGYCGVRKNIDGNLFSMIYGRVSSACADAIEKKPLYHFFPGSHTFSIGSLGCNMRCGHCQNWQIAHSRIDDSDRDTYYISPQELVRRSIENKCKGISWTYNEPTIWLEYAIDGAKLAKEKGLYTVFVTNGYIEPDALDAIGPFLDAYRVDIKGLDSYTTKGSSGIDIKIGDELEDARHCFYRDVTGIKSVKPILNAAIRAKSKWDMHVEIITNVVPGYNDDTEELHDIARWIVQNVGDETPWHVSRFHPYLELSHIPSTPVSTLESAREIGTEEGLKYVYIGNVPGHEWENTYCHSCGKMLIERAGFSVRTFEIRDGMCINCNAKIPIVGGFG